MRSHRWTEPILLAILTVAGLICAFFGSNLGDLMLAAPLLAILRHIMRTTRKEELR